MKNAYLLLIALLLLVMTGCGLTAEQMTSLQQSVDDMNAQSQAFRQSTQNQPTQVPTYQTPTVGSWGTGTNSTRSYLINTNNGLQQKRCRTSSNGTVYCW